MQLKRLAIIRRFYGPDGGAQRAVERMLSALGDSALDVTLICETAPPNWDGSLVKIHTNGGRTKRLVDFAQSASAEIKDGQYDIVQAHEWIPGADIYRLGDGLHSDWLKAKTSERNTLVSTVMGSLERSVGFHKEMLRLQQICLTQTPPADFICNSEMVMNSLRRQHPKIDTRRLHLVRNIPARHGSVKVADSKTLGFAGSGWSRKGLNIVIDSLQMLPEHRLVIAGRDKHQAKYQRQAEAAGVADRVQFLGVLESMDDFYHSISTLVHPAVYDPFPNVTMEALAQGIPCVVSEATGTSDFAGSDAVHLVPRNPSLVAKSVLKIGKNYNQASNAAVAIACKYDEPYLLKALTQAYSGLMDK